MQKQQNGNGNVLHCLPYNSVIDDVETDTKFIKDLKKMARVTALKSFVQTTQLTDNQCEDVALMAELHRDACRPNSTDLDENLRPITPDDRCPCGCSNTRGDTLPFCIPESKLKFMGSSLALSFLFMKVVAIVSFILLTIYGLFSLISDVVGNESDLTQCLQNYFCIFKRRLSLQGKQSNLYLIMVQMWLGVVACVLCIIVLRIARLKADKMHDRVDKSVETPSDLAIKLENLPFGECDEELIIDVLRKKEIQFDLGINESRQGLNIKAIHMVYNMSEPRRKIEEMINLSNDVYSFLVSPQTGKLKPGKWQEYVKQKMRLLNMAEELEDFRKRFLAESAFRRSLSTTCSIVQFDNEGSKNKFLKRFGSTSKGILEQIKMQIIKLFWGQDNVLVFKGSIIQVERAPQPEDILWENCEKKYSLGRLVVIWLVTLLMILISLGIIIGLEYLQIGIAKDPSFRQRGITTIVNYAISVTLIIINKLLWVVLFFLIKIEYNHTFSEQVISRVNKTIFAQSLNCIVLPMLSNLVLQNKLYGNQGLVGQVLDYSISNAVVSVALLYFDVGYIIKVLVLKIACLRVKVIRFLSKQEVSENKGMHFSTKVNELYEGGDFDITSSYVYLISNMLHVAFFCTLQPFILFLPLVCTIIFYYLKKYLLLHRYTSPKMLNKLVFDNSLVALAYVPVFYGIGSLVFVAYIYQPRASLIVPSALVILLGLINIANPKNFLGKITEFFDHLINRKTVSKKRIQVSPLNENSKSNIEIPQPKDNQKQGEPTKLKSVRTDTELDDKFKRNVEYYFHNNIATLIGSKKLLLDRPIGSDDRRIIKKFVESFGKPENDLYDYPEDVSSENELRLHNPKTKALQSVL